MEELYCRRCGNTKEFHKTSKGYYCEACKKMGRFYVDTPLSTRIWHFPSNEDSDYELSYSLSQKQQIASIEIIAGIQEKQDVLVYAACGAGKTEMVMPLITYCMKQHIKVGIAIPRKEVVIELQQRFKEAYSRKSVIAVYGEHHDNIDADLVICTTHQLFRYEKVFDVLIVDEVDAFPFRGDPLLESLVHFACKGNKVYLTATPSDEMLETCEQGKMKLVTLFERFHKGKLCIPEVKIGYNWYLYLHMLDFLHQHSHKTTLLFVPSIQKAYQLGRLLKYYCPSVLVLTSQSTNREYYNKEMKSHKYQIIVCTTVMERGITISDVQVIVLQADHPVFSLASLIQISGRVGRKVEAREGDCVFLCTKRSENVEKAINRLQEMNAHG
ncbi:MAG: DEAD/DEAH box helicase family protein [Erysipelotrichales bacterium]|nr:DEAD/DEAH box helicase family protein [Erysipelotrichales bacterium]